MRDKLTARVCEIRATLQYIAGNDEWVSLTFASKLPCFSAEDVQIIDSLARIAGLNVVTDAGVPDVLFRVA